MWSTRDIIIFCAGAQAFHTLTHVLMVRLCTLPIQLGPIAFTPQLNMYAIVINAVITVLLLWWANSL